MSSTHVETFAGTSSRILNSKILNDFKSKVNENSQIFNAYSS